MKRFTSYLIRTSNIEYQGHTIKRVCKGDLVSFIVDDIPFQSIEQCIIYIEGKSMKSRLNKN